MTDGVVAGRLEIPVESNTKGFGERLQAVINKEVANVVAKIGVEIDAAGLKGKLEAVVKEAAAGVTATIGVDVDAKTLKTKLVAAATAAGTAAKVKIGVEGLEEAVQEASEKVQRTVNRRPNWWTRLRTRPEDDDQLRKTVEKMLAKAQKEVDRKPLRLRLFGAGGGGGGKKGDKEDFELPDWLKPNAPARYLFRPTMILGMVSLIQPLVATVVGSLGGLAAMAGSAAASVNLLGAAGGPLFGLAAGLTVVKMAFKAIEGPIEDVPKKLRFVREEAEKLKKPWQGLREAVALSFWKQLDGQIERTGKVIIPILKSGLSDVGEEMGKTTRRIGEWMRTPLFKQQSQSIFKNLTTLTAGFGRGLEGAAKGLVNLTVAAGPTVNSLGQVLSNFGKWAGGIGDTADEQRRLGEAFSYAWEKAAQLWQMTKDLAAGLKAIFHAGRDTGDSLLRSFQDSLKAMRDWAESEKGQDSIRAWFEAMAPIAREVGSLIVDVAKALARLAVDSHTADLIHQIRSELLPSLEEFLRNLGESLGPQVVKFITNVLDILAQLSQAGDPLGAALGVINSFLSTVAQFLKDNDQLASNLGVLLGAFMAFRSLTFFAGLIPLVAKFFGLVRAGGILSLGATIPIILSFAGALAGWPKPIQAATLAMSGFLLLRPKLDAFGKGGGFRKSMDGLGAAFMYGAEKADGLKGKLTGLSGAMGYAMGGGAGGFKGGLKAAAGGLLSLLGGPWVVGIGLAAAAVGGFIQAQENARAAAMELNDTLDEQTGKFTEATRESLFKKFFADFNEADYRRVRDSLDAAGVGIGNLIAAYEQGGPAVEAFQAKFDAWQRSVRNNPDDAVGAGDAERIGNAYAAAGRDVDNSRIIFEENAKAQKILQDATAETGDQASTATTKLITYKEAQENLAAATDAADEAQKRLAQTLLGIGDAEVGADRAMADWNVTIQEAKSKLGEYKVTVDKTTGGLALNSKAGQDNQRTLEGLRDKALENAEAMLKNGSGATKAGKQMDLARKDFVKIATQMLGGNVKAAEELADRYQFTQETVDGLSESIGDVPKEAKSKVTVEAAVAQARLAAMRIALAAIKSKWVTVTTSFRTIGALPGFGMFGAVGSMLQKVAGMANGGIVQATVNGIVQKFAEGGIRLRSFANGKLPREALIAPDGANLINWAERGTGGEAFIPLAESKRARSMAILEDVASRFGMALSPLLDSVSGMPAARPAGPAGALMPRTSTPRQIVFEEGAVKVYNPAPEPAGRSVVSTLRDVASDGLFGGEDD